MSFLIVSAMAKLFRLLDCLCIDAIVKVIKKGKGHISRMNYLEMASREKLKFIT